MCFCFVLGVQNFDLKIIIKGITLLLLLLFANCLYHLNTRYVFVNVLCFGKLSPDFYFFKREITSTKGKKRKNKYKNIIYIYIYIYIYVSI